MINEPEPRSLQRPGQTGNGPIKVYEAAHSGTFAFLILQTHSHLKEIIYAIQISHDGKYMFSASEDRTIKFWSLIEDRLLHTFENAHDGNY